MNLYDIIEAIEAGRFRFTNHAEVEAANDGLTESEIYYSVFHGEILENYPDDKPLPSSLVYGLPPEGLPIHSVWDYNEDNRRAALITVYRPDPRRWIGSRERRPGI